MPTTPASAHIAAPASLIDSPQAAWRLLTTLGLVVLGTSSMYVVSVVLPAVQAEFGVGRADASLPYTLMMVCLGLGGLWTGRMADRHGLMPVLNDLGQIERWAADCRASGPHPAAIHLDTGMSRLGLPRDEQERLMSEPERLRNLAGNPRVAFLVDRYDDDWTHLWWVRADGTATVEHEGEHRAAALDALAARYPQYREHRPDGPLIRVRVTRWSGWAHG